MKLSIYGAGYVGLVSGICFAELGHDVCCVDIDSAKIAQLKKGILPIYEKDLASLLKKNVNENRLQFTDDFQHAVDHGIVQMIAVGTPPKADGSADLQFVEAVAKKIGLLMTHYRCVVNKSTVPVGTAIRVQQIISEALLQRRENSLCDVVSNPEFLREGRAVQDFLSPDRIVVGVQTETARELMETLYFPLTEKKHPLLVMDLASAELTKYAANAFLATKVSFMNEVSQIAERVGADIHAVKKGVGSDSRINEKFLNAGCGFGGSCFPKDISALKNIALQHHYEPHLLNAVLKINHQQQQLLFEKISRYFKGDLSNKTIALWGLAFKPNTDDVRSATSRVLMESLWEAGAKVQAYDPLAMQSIRQAYPHEKKLMLCEHAEAALKNADVLVIATEWDDFKSPDFEKIKLLLQYPAIFDGRNIYDRSVVRAMGLDYFGIGC